ncbi:unnamed protein product, partial [Choristocarpus tenellus]
PPRALATSVSPSTDSKVLPRGVLFRDFPRSPPKLSPSQTPSQSTVTAANATTTPPSLPAVVPVSVRSPGRGQDHLPPLVAGREYEDTMAPLWEAPKRPSPRRVSVAVVSPGVGKDEIDSSSSEKGVVAVESGGEGEVGEGDSASVIDRCLSTPLVPLHSMPLSATVAATSRRQRLSREAPEGQSGGQKEDLALKSLRHLALDTVETDLEEQLALGMDLAEVVTHLKMDGLTPEKFKTAIRKQQSSSLSTRSTTPSPRSNKDPSSIGSNKTPDAGGNSSRDGGETVEGEVGKKSSQLDRMGSMIGWIGSVVGAVTSSGGSAVVAGSVEGAEESEEEEEGAKLLVPFQSGETYLDETLRAEESEKKSDSGGEVEFEERNEGDSSTLLPPLHSAIDEVKDLGEKDMEFVGGEKAASLEPGGVESSLLLDVCDRGEGEEESLEEVPGVGNSVLSQDACEGSKESDPNMLLPPLLLAVNEAEEVGEGRKESVEGEKVSLLEAAGPASTLPVDVQYRGEGKEDTESGDGGGKALVDDSVADSVLNEDVNRSQAQQVEAVVVKSKGKREDGRGGGIHFFGPGVGEEEEEDLSIVA